MANQQDPGSQRAGSAMNSTWLIAGIVVIALIAGALWYYGTMSGEDTGAVTAPAADSEQMSAEEMAADEEMPADEGAPAEGAANAGE